MELTDFVENYRAGGLDADQKHIGKRFRIRYAPTLICGADADGYPCLGGLVKNEAYGADVGFTFPKSAKAAVLKCRKGKPVVIEAEYDGISVIDKVILSLRFKNARLVDP